MPTYDYACDACGHQYELFQSITEPVKKKCPACGKRKLRRLIGTGAAIMFKGSGFYQTDYRSESYKQKAEAEKKAASGESSGGNGQAKSGESKSGSAAASSKSSDSKGNKAKAD